MLNAIEMEHSVDPREEIMEKVKDFIDNYEIFHNKVLVATYMRSGKKTKSGLHLPDSVGAEDEFQGKCGLVLKMGPLAFVDDDRTKFGGVTVEVGDWIIYRPSDGWPQNFKKIPLRVFDDTFIMGRISSPDMIY